LQKLTGISDNVVLSTQAILATFKRIKGDAFERAVKAGLDMGTVLRRAGTDVMEVERAMIQFGKALNDPISNLGGLGRIGIQFDKATKAQIKSLAEQTRMFEALEIILKELEEEFGGAADGMNETVKAMDRLKATFSDVGEQIGKAIAETDVFGGVIETLQGYLEDLAASGYIELWAENVRAAINSVLPFMNMAVGAIGKLRGLQTGAGNVIGSMLGGLSIGESVAGAGANAAEVRARTQQRLAELRAERAAAKENADIREEAEKARVRMAQYRARLEELEGAGVPEAAEERQAIGALIGAEREHAKARIEAAGAAKAEAEADKLRSELATVIDEGRGIRPATSTPNPELVSAALRSEMEVQAANALRARGILPGSDAGALSVGGIYFDYDAKLQEELDRIRRNMSPQDIAAMATRYIERGRNDYRRAVADNLARREAIEGKLRAAEARAAKTVDLDSLRAQVNDAMQAAERARAATEDSITAMGELWKRQEAVANEAWGNMRVALLDFQLGQARDRFDKIMGLNQLDMRAKQVGWEGRMRRQADLDRAEAEDTARLAKIAERRRLGQHISKKDREWLDARNKFGDAMKEAGEAQSEMTLLRDALKQAKSQVTILGKIRQLLEQNLTASNG